MWTRLFQCKFDVHCSYSQTKGFCPMKINGITEYQKPIKKFSFMIFHFCKKKKFLTSHKGRDAKIFWSELVPDCFDC